MKQMSTFGFGRLRLRTQKMVPVAAMLVFLILVQGALALPGDESAASALSPTNLLATAQRQAEVLYVQAEQLVSNLRLAYEIQVFLAGESVETEAVPAAGTEQASCSLSATGLAHTWAD
jgi:hypothetical protein